MSPAQAISVGPQSPQAFFLSTPAGHLAAMHHRPPPGVPCRTALLYIHPFAHELYHSRPVMAFVFRTLADQGVATLSIDLPGCGDSAGEFADARWDGWQAAVESGFEWLEQQSGVPVNVCGLRLGAALALDLANRKDCRCEKVILLEPVLSGEEMMTQYLRLRVAFSGLRNLPGKRETTQDLRRRLAEGEQLDVGGYLLAPELVEAIDAVSLSKWRPASGKHIEWVHNRATASHSSVAEAWTMASAQVTFHSVHAKPWWVHTRAAASDYQDLASTLNSIVAIVKE